MNQQPEALRLAEVLDVEWRNDALNYDTALNAAAELRRLYWENEALKAELLEQARVNGMGGERELKLMAENEALRKDAEQRSTTHGEPVAIRWRHKGYHWTYEDYKPDQFYGRVERQLLYASPEASAQINHAKADAVMWQYRWTNPGNNPDVSQIETDWQPLNLAPGYTGTIESKVAELEAYRYCGKPIYECRGLGVVRNPAPAAQKEQP